MKNTVIVTIPFSFKGQDFAPSAEIDLNYFCQQNYQEEFISHLVASGNQIDNYSYEYEVLCSSPQQFSHATGMATDFLSADQFDLDGFKQALVEQRIFSQLQHIATETLGIENLKEHPPLSQALLQAYHADVTKK